MRLSGKNFDYLYNNYVGTSCDRKINHTLASKPSKENQQVNKVEAKKNLIY